MADQEYRIKLYGHSDEDAEAFCDKASRLLGVDPAQFRRLLARKPVIVKGGLEKDKAVRLLRGLKSINALAIIEAEDGAVPDVDLQAAYGSHASRVFPTAKARAQPDVVPQAEKKEQWRFRIWTGLLIGVLGVAVIVGGAAYFFSYRHVRQDVARMDKDRSERSGAIRAQKDAAELAEIEREIARLRRETQRVETLIEGLRTEKAYRDRAVAKAYNDNLGRESTELILRRRQAEQTNAELKEAQQLLKDLKTRLAQTQDRQQRLAH
ncbi:MAG: hypothetical protein AB1646_07150 [Thermodesulfobacteriota bacterium]